MRKRIYGFLVTASLCLGGAFMFLNPQPVQAQACGEPDERITSDPRVCMDFAWDCDSDGSQRPDTLQKFC